MIYRAAGSRSSHSGGLLKVASYDLGELLLLGGTNNKADGAGGRWVLYFLDVLDHGFQDDGVLLLRARVLFLVGFQLVDFTGQVLVGGQQFAHFDKGTDDEDVHLYGAFAVENG